MGGDSGATATVEPLVLHLASDFAREMTARGARGAILCGSHARGDAQPESDVDLTFFGEDREVTMAVRDGYLFSLYRRSFESMKRMLSDPREVGAVVPGLRRAVVLDDPDGRVMKLKAEAERWTWDGVADTCDTWVAEQVANYAEDALRLAKHVRLGNPLPAGVFRSVIADEMAGVLAVRLRILYETENALWDLVAREMGEPWTSVQHAALGTGDESFDVTCRAALRLYSLASGTVRHLFDEHQLTVVEHACRTIGFPLP